MARCLYRAGSAKISDRSGTEVQPNELLNMATTTTYIGHRSLFLISNVRHYKCDNAGR